MHEAFSFNFFISEGFTRVIKSIVYLFFFFWQFSLFSDYMKLLKICAYPSVINLLTVRYLCRVHFSSIGGWWQYECRISEEIENGFKIGEKELEVIICGEIYIIDLNTRYQYQKNNPIKRRKIKRSSVSETRKKGIAGLVS